MEEVQLPSFMREAEMKVREEDAVKMEEEVVLLEAGECLKTFKKDKTLGQDGLPMEFYQSFWDFVGLDLTQVFKEVLQEGSWVMILTQEWLFYYKQRESRSPCKIEDPQHF